MTLAYNKSSEKTKRKQLRRNMTLPEIILWSKLKGRGMGQKFRRQHSVEAFVLDFCCPVLKLAIEVDGDSHFSEEARIRDMERQKIIENYGFAFLRFTNREIVENLDGVLSTIERLIHAMTTPPPPCKGGDVEYSGQAKHAARKGGEVAGKERKDLEKKTGKMVVSKENYLTTPQGMKKLKAEL